MIIFHIVKKGLSKGTDPTNLISTVVAPLNDRQSVNVYIFFIEFAGVFSSKKVIVDKRKTFF